jgi:hypothetical protein
MAVRSTQPLTEMSIRKLPGGKGQLVRKAENLTVICKPTVDMSRPYGPPRPVPGIAFFFFFF